MLDKYNVRNATTIVLTTPETNAGRSLVKTIIEHPPISFKPPRYDRDGHETYRVRARSETRYHSRWANYFSMVFVDEASKIKSPASLRHIGIQRLLSRRWVFITATPMINKGTCILGPMSIIWESIVAKVEKMANPEMSKWLSEQVPSLDAYSKASDLSEKEFRRLGVLKPYSAKLLLESENTPLIASCFLLIEQSMVLRRTTAHRSDCTLSESRRDWPRIFCGFR
jgi:hypothetical protein